MAQSDEEKYKGNEKVLKQLDVVKRKELELAELKKAQKTLDKLRSLIKNGLRENKQI